MQAVGELDMLACKHAIRQAYKQADSLAGRRAGSRRVRYTSRQTCKQASIHAGRRTLFSTDGQAVVELDIQAVTDC